MKRKIINLTYIIYLIWILRITVFRPSMGLGHFFSGKMNMTLFQEYLPLIRNGAWRRVVYLFVGNIVCFIPFGLYLQWHKKRRLVTIALIGLLFSLFIETMQYILGTGISELDDLILNTLGAVAGALLSRFWKRRLEREDAHGTVRIRKDI